MCDIAGKIFKSKIKIDNTDVLRMQKVLLHRGPDGKKSDFTSNAVEFTVVPGDFFNNNAPQNQKISPLYVDGKWKYD